MAHLSTSLTAKQWTAAQSRFAICACRSPEQSARTAGNSRTHVENLRAQPLNRPANFGVLLRKKVRSSILHRITFQGEAATCVRYQLT